MTDKELDFKLNRLETAEAVIKATKVIVTAFSGETENIDNTLKLIDFKRDYIIQDYLIKNLGNERKTLVAICFLFFLSHAPQFFQNC